VPSIKPFKGIIYNKKAIKDLAKVVAPPYDVIPPKMQDDLYKKHENNIVRLILGKIKKTDDEKDNRYTRAKDFFESWLRKFILIKDQQPAVYIYSQGYKFEDRSIERIGFISLMELDFKNKKAILPHENTLKAPKMDRLNLMRMVKANLSPIFMLYEDKSRTINKLLEKFCKTQEPFIDIKIDGVRHRAWKLIDKNTIEIIKAFLDKKNIFIADGHHRYETACNYAAEIENSVAPQELKDNSKYLMAYFCELDDETLTILPTHRLIKDIGNLNKEDILRKLEKFFIVEDALSSKRLLLRLRALKGYHAFGVYLGEGAFFVIRLKKDNLAEPFMGKNSKYWTALDVAILHLFVIQNVLALRDEDDNIEFVKDAPDAFRSVDSGKFKMAFFLNPTKVSQLKKVAEHGEKMPRKATYFYPKPLSGIVINKF